MIVLRFLLGGLTAALLAAAFIVWAQGRLTPPVPTPPTARVTLPDGWVRLDPNDLGGYNAIGITRMSEDPDRVLLAAADSEDVRALSGLLVVQIVGLAQSDPVAALDGLEQRLSLKANPGADWQPTPMPSRKFGATVRMPGLIQRRISQRQTEIVHHLVNHQGLAILVTTVGVAATAAQAKVDALAASISFE